MFSKHTLKLFLIMHLLFFSFFPACYFLTIFIKQFNLKVKIEIPTDMYFCGHMNEVEC
jgi:hypothetical protein